MGDHNLSDMSLENEVQKGLQAPSPEVKSGPGIVKHLVPWARVLQPSNLSLQVAELFGRRDSSVDEPTTLGARWFTLAALCEWGAVDDLGDDVFTTVPSMAAIGDGGP